MDLEPRSDVHAAGWLVEQQNACGAEPGQGDLLLVAAAQLRHRDFAIRSDDVKILDELASLEASILRPLSRPRTE